LTQDSSETTAAVRNPTRHDCYAQKKKTTMYF